MDGFSGLGDWVLVVNACESVWSYRCTVIDPDCGGGLGIFDVSLSVFLKQMPNYYLTTTTVVAIIK